MKKLALAFGLIFTLIQCTKAPSTNTNLLHLIPQKSAAVLRIPDWKDFGESLKVNEPISLLSETGLHTTLTEYARLFKNFNPSGDTYLAFVALGDNDYDLALITKSSENLVSKDSSYTAQTSVYDYEGTSITQSSINDTNLFYLIADGIFIASTSKLILENSILQNNSGRDPIDESLKKMIQTSDAQSNNLYVKGSYFKKLFKDIVPGYTFSSRKIPFDWLALDLELDSDFIQLNGIITATNEEHQTLGLLKNLNSKPALIASVAPSSIRSFVSFNYGDWEVYKSNLAQQSDALLKDFQLPLEELMQSIDEVSVIYKEEKELIICHSINLEESEKAMAPFSTEKENYREMPIYQIADSTAFQKSFELLLNPPAVHFYCYLDSFIAFAETSNELKDLIANYQNNATLANNLSYIEFAKKLSDESNLYLYGNTSELAQYLVEKVSKTEKEKLKSLKSENYPNTAVQLVDADDFIYVNAALYKIKTKKEKSQVVQQASVKLKNELLTSPQFLKNYRTKGQDILVQDVANILYHIDSSGKIEWQKELDGPILGTIQQVDLYKNGRLQYAFTTPSHFYIIASDGDIVKPFDFTYTSNVTQPLSVFDYDGNRNYRFIITQDTKVTMLDGTGSVVNGFEYKKASAPLSQPLQHIRLGSKDYILAQLKNGTLEILDRRGQVRIPVKEKFSFSENLVFTDNTNFLLREANGDFVSISQSGKINRTKSSKNKDSKFAKLGKLEASISQNILQINDKEIELELGIYTGLKIVRAKNAYYVCLTNLQENQGYVFNSKGVLLPNFPVYGSSEIDFGNLNSAESLGFVTKGESDSVIIYQIN